MASFCPNCGAPINGMKFCMTCGTNVEEIVTAAEPETVISETTVSEAPIADTVAEEKEEEAVMMGFAAEEVAEAPAPQPVLQPQPMPTPVPAPQSQPMPAPVPTVYQKPVDAAPKAGSAYEPISTAGYIGIFLLMGVPVIGLIFLIVWACGGCQKISKRNFSRAILILLLITIVVLTVLGVAGYIFTDMLVNAINDLAYAY